MEVTAAVFFEHGRVLLMRRAEGHSCAGGWEFPGGKIEIGETGEQCLARELSEELRINAEIGELLAESSYAYSNGTVHLQAYKILAYQGDIQLTVHDKMEWIPINKLLQHDLLPADYEISKRLMEVL